MNLRGTPVFLSVRISLRQQNSYTEFHRENTSQRCTEYKEKRHLISEMPLYFQGSFLLSPFHFLLVLSCFYFRKLLFFFGIHEALIFLHRTHDELFVFAQSCSCRNQVAHNNVFFQTLQVIHFAADGSFV